MQQQKEERESERDSERGKDKKGHTGKKRKYTKNERES